MIVREATAADDSTLVTLQKEIFAERWDRPWPPPEVIPKLWAGKLVLLAEEDGEPLGFAFGEIQPNRAARI